MSLDQLAIDCNKISTDNGFWNDKVDIHFILAKLALVHSEVSEVLEAVRKTKGSEAVVEEIADIIIRVLDWYQGARVHNWIYSEISLDEILKKKMDINANRPYKHGNLA